MQTSRGAAFREPPGIYRCMKETTGRIAAARRRGTTRVKDRTRSPWRRVRSGTLGRDSTDVTAATAAAGQSACRAMTHPAAGASCKLSRVVQPAVSRQPWYRHDQCSAFDGTGAEKKGRKNSRVRTERLGSHRTSSVFSLNSVSNGAVRPHDRARVYIQD